MWTCDMGLPSSGLQNLTISNCCQRSTNHPLINLERPKKVHGQNNETNILRSVTSFKMPSYSRLSKRSSGQSIINGMVALIACILILVVAIVMGTVHHQNSAPDHYAILQNDAHQRPSPPRQQPLDDKVVPRWISEEELDDVDVYGKSEAERREKVEGRRRLEKRIIDANGNGITFPTTNTPLTFGVTYRARFVTAAMWNWTAIRLDLYTIAAEERFVANLNTVDAAQAINEMSLQGEIPFTLSTNVGTGAVYVLRISGTDRRTGLPLVLPRSEVFSIIDPNAGSWVYPDSSTVLYSGRTIKLNFTLGRPFMSSTMVRVEISAAVLPKSMVIINSIPVNFTNTYTTIDWHIPPYFQKGQFYFLRVLPNDGPSAAISDANSGVGLSLPSQGFTLFENSVFNQKELTFTSIPSIAETGSQTTIRYTYTGTSKVSRWNVDLISAGPASKFPLGLTIGVSTSSSSFAWNVSQELPSGMYFLRIYGFKDSDKISPDVDPVSRMSDAFTITNTASGPDLRISAAAATPFTKGGRANVTFLIQRKADNVSVNGFVIDLLKNTSPYKYLQQLTPEVLPPNTTWTLINVPTTLINAFDYFVRVRAIIDGNTFSGHDVGAMTSQFQVKDPEPNVRNASTVIATFGNDPWAVTATTTRPPATGGGGTYMPDPSSAKGGHEYLGGGGLWKSLWVWSGMSVVALVMLTF
ncbi:hypothetical protein BC829DRAFT_387432 [Chytridium lagenaria]|nr:hypothetical protein BC829DRAFT_387432 [Chytridium lagenaria]